MSAGEHTADFPSTAGEAISPVRTGSRWPGSFLSLFAPGFGLIRAGRYRRGFCWFFGLLLFPWLAFWILALESIPALLGIALLVAGLVSQVVMLADSFRPGRITFKAGLLYAAMVTLVFSLPLPLAVFRVYRIPTDGMKPTLMGAMATGGPDYIVVNPRSYSNSKPKRGDIVVFSTGSIPAIAAITRSRVNTQYVKRVVGLPGERIEIRDGTLYADGVKLGSKDGVPPIPYENAQSGAVGPYFPLALPEGASLSIGPGEYLALGDNSGNSLDGRYWGCVPESAIIGKVTKIIFPISRIGKPYFPNP